eukprot:COSAG06_NODE_3911_length_4780_cov_42.288827_4_plen_191_part_00
MHQTWLRPVERWPKQALGGRKMPLTAAEVAHCSYQTAGSLPPTTSPWTARRAANTQDYCRRLWCSQGDGWGQATDAMPARRAPSASILEANAARQPASSLATWWGGGSGRFCGRFGPKTEMRTIIKLSFCAQTEQLASAQAKGTKKHPTLVRNAGAPLETLPSGARLHLARVVPRALGCEARELERTKLT